MSLGLEKWNFNILDSDKNCKSGIDLKKKMILLVQPVAGGIAVQDSNRFSGTSDDRQNWSRRRRWSGW